MNTFVEAPPQSDLTPAQDFLVRVAECLHAYGTPAHRLERLLARMAEALGVRAQFLSTPTSLLLAFGEGIDQRPRLLRVEPGQDDLGKLVEFDELLEEVEAHTLPLAAARERIERLAAAPPRYGPGTTALASGLASAGAAVLFGGGAAEVGATFGLGVGVDVLARRLAGRADGTRLLELGASFLVALAAVVLGAVAPLGIGVVTLASLIVLVPGLTLTVAMIELATRHLVSGTARLFGALTSFLTIALGVALGRAAGTALVGAPALLEPVALPGWALLVALGVSPVAFAVLFQARTSELPWIVAAGVGGVLGARWGTATLGVELGPCVGALVVGVVANLFARLKDRPASVPLTPGILLLVPGSIGYRALDLFLARDVVAGMENAFRVAMVATALVGGLLVANVVLPPRRSL